MTDPKLPDFIDRDALRDISTVEIPDEALLRCFVRVNKPFLSNSAVADMTGLSDEGARKRLNSLVDMGVLLSAEAGKQTKIYWLNDPRSRWPVPDDLEISLSEDPDQMTNTVTKINRLTTFTTFFAGLFVVMYVIEWLGSLRVTDGVFRASLHPNVMPTLAIVLLAILSYIALQTSLLIENDDLGWPTIRRIYRRVVS